MSNDPLHEVAWLELQVDAAAALEVTFAHDPDLTPIQAVLARARSEAASALQQLVCVDPLHTEEIRRLQNEARRYESLVGWLKEVMDGGKEAAGQLKVIFRERAEEFRTQIFGDAEDETGATD